jgi:hypothetical protein
MVKSRRMTDPIIESIDDRFKKLEHAIFGDGEIGMDEVVRSTNKLAVQNAEDIKKVFDRIDDFRNGIDEFRPTLAFVKVAMWGGGIIGASIIALIWSLITGRADITFH